MSFERRRRILAGLLLGVALWPAVHHALVRGASIDPWKLFGWAMYAAPPGRVQVRVDGVARGARSPLRLFGEAADARDAFARRRASLGRLARPDALAEEVLATDPDLDEVVVVVRGWSLDARSARLRTRDEEIRVSRTEIR